MDFSAARVFNEKWLSPDVAPLGISAQGISFGTEPWAPYTRAIAKSIVIDRKIFHLKHVYYLLVYNACDRLISQMKQS